jgi:hypothetical protein
VRINAAENDAARIGFNLSIGDVDDNVDALPLLSLSRLHAQLPTPHYANAAA